MPQRVRPVAGEHRAREGFKLALEDRPRAERELKAAFEATDPSEE